MDEKIAVLTDTNSGITPEQAARYGIYLVAMPVIIDDETYFENESIFQEEFFQRLREGARVSTSQPAPCLYTLGPRPLGRACSPFITSLPVI